MASIRPSKRRDGTFSFKVVWREDGKQTSRTFDTEADAADFKRFLDGNNNTYRLAVAAKRQSRAEGPSVDEMIASHIDQLTGVEPRTRSDYRRDARLHLTPALGALKVVQLSRRHVRDWVNDMDAAGTSPKSISNYHGLLSAVMNTAVAEGVRDDNPCKGVRLPEREHRDDTDFFLETWEYALLLDQFPKQWSPVVELLAGTGARWSEGTALKVGDAVLDASVPYVKITKAWKRDDNNRFYLSRPKTRRSVRNVTISEPLAELLGRLVAGRDPDDWLLRTPRGHSVSYPYFHTRVWTPAVKRAAKPADRRTAPLRRRPTPHHLRHSHGSWLINEGVDIFTVQRRLGHESIKTTLEIYGHLSERSGRETADAIGRALGQ